MSQLLFNTPWWLPTLLIGAGVILFWNGNRRGEARVRNAGGVLIALAVALMIVSYLVETDTEKALRETKTLVYSVEKRDWTTINKILSPSTTLSVAGAFQIYADRAEIIAGAKAAVDRYGLKNVRILSSNVEKTGSLIMVSLTIYSEHDATMGRPITTGWQFEWQQTGNSWNLVRITNVKIGNESGQSAATRFPRP